jgi:hypothetical protein
MELNPMLSTPMLNNNGRNSHGSPDLPIAERISRLPQIIPKADEIPPAATIDRKAIFNQMPLPCRKKEHRFDPTFFKCPKKKIAKYESKDLKIWGVSNPSFSRIYFYLAIIRLWLVLLTQSFRIGIPGTI